MSIDLDTGILAPLCVAFATSTVITGGMLFYAKCELGTKIAKIAELEDKIKREAAQWKNALDGVREYNEKEIERKEDNLKAWEETNKRLHRLVSLYSRIYDEDIEFYKSGKHLSE